MSEYKYIIFFLVLLIGVPCGIILVCRSRLWERIILFLMMFFTCSLVGTINFASVPDYRGTSRGFEIGLVDMATLVIFGFIVLQPKFKLKLFPPGTFLFFIYLVFSMISMMNAANVLYSWFEVWKMLRMYFYFWVLYNYFIDFDRIQQVIKMLPLLIIYIFVIVIYQKKMGAYQPGGPFPHQNTLSMYVMVPGGIFLASLFEIRMKQLRTLYILGLFGACSLLEYLSLSRAGVLCYGGCCSIIIFVSFLVKFKIRKVLIFMLIGFVGLSGLIYYANAMYERYMYAPETSLESRENLAISAENMANDKIFGIGLNNFGIKVNADYPYSKHYMPEGFKEGLVESIYLMIAAETGWFNMLLFMCLLMYFYFVNLRNIFRYQNNRMIYLPIALAGGLAAIYLQSCLEWVLKQSSNFYQLMFFFAIIMAMAKIHMQNVKRTQIKEAKAKIAAAEL